MNFEQHIISSCNLLEKEVSFCQWILTNLEEQYENYSKIKNCDSSDSEEDLNNKIDKLCKVDEILRTSMHTKIKINKNVPKVVKKNINVDIQKVGANENKINYFKLLSKAKIHSKNKKSVNNVKYYKTTDMNDVLKRIVNLKLNINDNKDKWSRFDNAINSRSINYVLVKHKNETKKCSGIQKFTNEWHCCVLRNYINMCRKMVNEER
ncbi:hypothetical protein A3Q56_02804 [Intoshia linei]|uniref:Uncharacterized protein n=1 Tax=Intoshia linei TaxID=1819745 RepID=A0A177B6X1_9BILA|nr:hypothetical protein A3Q56_02804 [Intoshia linei]